MGSVFFWILYSVCPILHLHGMIYIQLTIVLILAMLPYFIHYLYIYKNSFISIQRHKSTTIVCGYLGMNMWRFAEEFGNDSIHNSNLYTCLHNSNNQGITFTCSYIERLYIERSFRTILWKFRNCRFQVASMFASSILTRIWIKLIYQSIIRRI